MDVAKKMEGSPCGLPSFGLVWVEGGVVEVLLHGFKANSQFCGEFAELMRVDPVAAASRRRACSKATSTCVMVCVLQELHISEEHMNWLMYLQDIRGLPKEQRQKGNHPAEMPVLGAMAMFLVAVNMKERSYLLIASVFVIFAAVLYLTGVLNPYSVMIRKIKKELRRFPKVPSYTEWSKPANADEKDS